MSRANELFETELSHGTEHRVDVAMVPGAVLDDFEGVFERNELLPLEYASDGIDLLARQFGQVGKCALARFLALGIPIGLTEQNGGFGVAVGHDIDVHGYYIHYIGIYNNNKYNKTWLLIAGKNHTSSAVTPCD